MRKLIAIIKISWYYYQSEKALDKAFEALRRNDVALAVKFKKLSGEYEKKANACKWTKTPSSPYGYRR